MTPSDTMRSLIDRLREVWPRVSQRLLSAAITFVLFAGVIWVIVILMHFFAPAYISEGVDPVTKAIDPTKQSAVQTGRNSILIKRTFVVAREGDFAITRELYKTQGEDTVIRADLSMSTPHYKAQWWQTKRVVEIPDLEPGEWTVANTVCWWNLWIFRDCVDLPKIKVMISGMP